MFLIKKSSLTLQVSFLPSGVSILRVSSDPASQYVNARCFEVMISSLQIVTNYYYRQLNHDNWQQELVEYYKSKGWEVIVIPNDAEIQII